MNPSSYYYMDRESGSSSYGKCVLCPLHCKDCTKEGYGNGKCVECSAENCTECNSYNISCLECNIGFRSVDGECVECMANYAKCDSNSTIDWCDKPMLEFIKALDNTIKKCPDGCELCLENNLNLCTKCLDGYFPKYLNYNFESGECSKSNIKMRSTI